MTAMALREAPPTPLEQSLPRLETLLSPYTGIVRELHDVLVAPDEARLVKVAATTAAMHLSVEEAEQALEAGAGGYASDARRARAAALGEAAERYAGCLPPSGELLVGSAAELGPATVDPRRFALFAPEQHARAGFPFVPFDEHTRVRWLHGFALADGARALLPVQLVHLGWALRPAGEPPIGYATSSGLACGPTLEEALLAGLLELVERDAFMLVWNGRLSPPLLDIEGDRRLEQFADRYLAATAARWSLVDLSGFLDVPAALAIVHGDGRQEPALAVGAGAAATIADAVEKALAEAFAVRSWGRNLMLANPAPTFAPDYGDVVSFRDHIALYTRREMAAPAAFLTAASAVRPTGAVPPLPGATPLAQIRAVLQRLDDQQVSAYGVDVTSPDVAAAGVVVAKVVAPELCALDVRHDARFLGGRRLYELPRRLGLAEHVLRWQDVNLYPHPFP